MPRDRARMSNRRPGHHPHVCRARGTPQGPAPDPICRPVHVRVIPVVPQTNDRPIDRPTEVTRQCVPPTGGGPLSSLTPSLPPSQGGPRLQPAPPPAEALPLQPLTYWTTRTGPPHQQQPARRGRGRGTGPPQQATTLTDHRTGPRPWLRRSALSDPSARSAAASTSARAAGPSARSAGPRVSAQPDGSSRSHGAAARRSAATTQRGAGCLAVLVVSSRSALTVDARISSPPTTAHARGSAEQPAYLSGSRTWTWCAPRAMPSEAPRAVPTRWSVRPSLTIVARWPSSRIGCRMICCRMI